MTLSKELLDILCCPMCKGELVYDASANTLTCNACALVFPVKDGIPMMRPEDGVPLRKQDAQ
jgi:uncharacterized protein YbaR (Trm112 family)